MSSKPKCPDLDVTKWGDTTEAIQLNSGVPGLKNVANGDPTRIKLLAKGENIVEADKDEELKLLLLETNALLGCMQGTGGDGGKIKTKVKEVNSKFYQFIVQDGYSPENISKKFTWQNFCNEFKDRLDAALL